MVIDNRSTYEDLLIDIIHFAEDTFSGFENNKKFLIIYVNEKESSLKQILLKQNYEQLPSECGTLQFSLITDIPKLSLPAGFEVKSLSEVYDFDKLSKLIWEGFNYKGRIKVLKVHLISLWRNIEYKLIVAIQSMLRHQYKKRMCRYI